jgi:hypothetical protein
VALLAGSLAVGLALIEATALMFVPPWPAYALRSIAPDKQAAGSVFNSWGMRDQAHSIDRPPDIKARFAFVGDSFVEFQPLSRTLPQAVEQRFLARGTSGVETMNFGISGTGIQSYFYRLRDVAMKFGPDSVSVFFFSGNDFVTSADDYSGHWFPPLIDESPGRSIVGSVMPRTNWLLVNRLHDSEFLRNNSFIPNEFEALQGIARAPRNERLDRLVQFTKQYYFPEMEASTLAEILSRGDGRLLAAFGPRPVDEEYLPGWLVHHIVDADAKRLPRLLVRKPEDAAAFVTQADIDANLSWLRQIDRVARSKGIPLDIFVIPTGSVDPEFVEFWKPWPNYYSWYVHCALRHDLLVEALKKTNLSVVDLKPDFEGIPGTYRKGDGHWTERGLDIAAARVFLRLSERFARLPAD